MCHRTKKDHEYAEYENKTRNDDWPEDFEEYSEEPLPESFRPRRDGPGGE